MKYTYIILTILFNLNLTANDTKKENICYQEHKHHHEFQNCDCKIREEKSCKVEDSIEKLIKKLQEKKKH